MARPFQVGWQAQDTAAALRAADRAEADAEVRQRLHALWLLRAGRPLVEVAMVPRRPRPLAAALGRLVSGGRAAGRAHRQGGPGQAPRLMPGQQTEVAQRMATDEFRWEEPSSGIYAAVSSGGAPWPRRRISRLLPTRS